MYAWRIATEGLRGERELLVTAPARDDAWLESLDNRIQRFRARFAPATHVIMGDRFTTLDSLSRMHTAGGRLDRRGSRQWDGVMDAVGFDQSRYRGPLEDSLAWLDRFTEAADASARATGANIPQADAALESAHAAFVDLGIGPGERWPALMITLTEYAQPIAWERHTRIAAAGTRVVLAIERYRLANGQPPASLVELGDLLSDGLEVDPVTEQPWEYRRIDERYTLASRMLPGYESDEEADADPLAGIQIMP